MPVKKDFQRALEEILREHDRQGEICADVKAGELHRRLGGYPGPGNRMPTCCDLMKENMEPGDEILNEPPKGRGASLRIRYKLPRPQAYQGQQHALIVVSCTKKKIWDENVSADPYVPAQHAYAGTTVKDWLSKYQPKLSNYPWIVMSAKYGFIEPDHPIANYDVTFSDPRSGPISDETLKNQVRYQPRFLGGQRKLLCDFRYVAVKGSSTYLEKAKLAFSDMSAKVIKFEEFWQELTTQNARPQITDKL